MANVDVDIKAVEQLAREIAEAQKALIGRLAERGYQLLREEVPYITGNLRQGVAPPMMTFIGRQISKSENTFGETNVDYENLSATLTVSARSARTGGRQAQVVGADGEVKKTVTLRPQKAFNYAEAVARGRPAISPKRARVLIIPVAVAPTGESYLLADGKIYVFRRSAEATRPNPFDERAAKRLENEAGRIGDAVLRKFFE